MNRLGILALVVLLLGFSSCNKEKKKWKEPVDVTFRMDVNRTAAMSGDLKFTGGTFSLNKFDFDGKRTQADDVFFTKSFSGEVVSFDPNKDIAALDFVIPQGTYSNISVVFVADGEGDKSIVVEGTYTSSSSITNPLRLEMEAIEIYTVVATAAGGSNEIVLDKDVASMSTITLDPVLWFQPVSTSLLDNATLVNVSGTPTILINDANNEDIFDLVIDRAEDGAEVVFD